MVTAATTHYSYCYIVTHYSSYQEGSILFVRARDYYSISIGTVLVLVPVHFEFSIDGQYRYLPRGCGRAANPLYLRLILLKFQIAGVSPRVQPNTRRPKAAEKIRPKAAEIIHV